MKTQNRNAGLGWLNKVPEVTLTFWVIKMMSTTVGETAADYLNFDQGFGLTGTSIVVGLLLAVFLGLQLWKRHYVPACYWAVVLFISVFGTLITDNLTDNYGIPLAASTIAFGIALIAAFILWYKREATLSIHEVDTPTRELFYWLAVLLTFALGTAAGDWLAEGAGLGYLAASAVFGAAILTTAIAYYGFDANATACFWIAYVLTRPFGAACGDLLSQPVSNGGLGFGTANINIAFLSTIVGLVAYLSFSRKNPAVQSIKEVSP